MQFVADGVFYAELNELLTRELAEHGYSGVEVRVTPMRTEIIIRATRTQNVLGMLNHLGTILLPISAAICLGFSKSPQALSGCQAWLVLTTPGVAKISVWSMQPCKHSL